LSEIKLGISVRVNCVSVRSLYLKLNS